MRYLLPLLFAGLTPIGCRGANDGFVARRDCSNFGGGRRRQPRAIEAGWARMRASCCFSITFFRSPFSITFFRSPWRQAES